MHHNYIQKEMFLQDLNNSIPKIHRNCENISLNNSIITLTLAIFKKEVNCKEHFVNEIVPEPQQRQPGNSTYINLYECALSFPIKIKESLLLSTYYYLERKQKINQAYLLTLVVIHYLKPFLGCSSFDRGAASCYLLLTARPKNLVNIIKFCSYDVI